METRTIVFDRLLDTVPLTRRIVTRLMVVGIWLAVTAISGIVFMLGFVGLSLILLHFIDRNLAMVIASSLPALMVGLVAHPLKQYLTKILEKRIRLHQLTDDRLLTNTGQDTMGPPLDIVGRQVGAYQLQEVIGRGGMAEVYQAVGNDSIVAIKVMHAHYRYDEENLRRFQREGEFGLGMIHDNIVAVYEVGEVDQVPYLVMEFVDGEDLRRVIRRTDDYSINDILLWMDDLGDALDMAHKQGYVHRDIKPSNIMIRPSGDAVLMDFGIAKFKHATTHITGASLGTIDYMAPEQIQNAKNIDHRADIYALGIVTFELLTGLLPYEGSIPQIMYAHINHPSPDPREFNKNVPDYIGDAVMKALAKNPDDRFQSAGGFAAALHGEN